MLPLPSPLSPFQPPEELEGRNWDTPLPSAHSPSPSPSAAVADVAVAPFGTESGSEQLQPGIHYDIITVAE